MKKILIIDSDEQITSVLQLKLQKENFVVETLSSAVKAIDFVRKLNPDMIISEMVLAEFSGVDLLKTLKMNPATSKIPFIFLSNSRNVEDKILAHEMGAEAFFMKPVFIKVLINRIKDFFEEENFNLMISSSKELKNFTGDITSISVIDILNIISENKLTGNVTFASLNEKHGTIFFVNGSVIRIENKESLNKNGIDELYKILSWIEGTFNIKYGEVNVVRNVNISHDKLVMRAVNWFEDYSGDLSKMPPLDTVLYFNLAEYLSNINKFPDTITEIIKNISHEGVRLNEIIDRTYSDKKETVKYIRKMIDMNIISQNKTDFEYIVKPIPEWAFQKDENTKTIEENVSQNEFSEEKTVNIPKNEETLVPPPSFAKNNTLDPSQIGIIPLKDDILNTETAKKPKYIILLLVLAVFVAIAIILFHFYPNYKTDFVKPSKNISSEIRKTEKKKPENKSDFSVEQKKMLEYSIVELIKKSNEFFENEEYEKAVETNRLALYKLRMENIISGDEYNKVIINMGIYLYSSGKYEEALIFADESLKIRDDEKSIELKVAIYEELKQYAAAASLLRKKIDEEKYIHKKEEWMTEINRLEQKKQ